MKLHKIKILVVIMNKIPKMLMAKIQKKMINKMNKIKIINKKLIIRIILHLKIIKMKKRNLNLKILMK